MDGTATAKLLWHLEAAEIIGSTTVQSRPTARIELRLDRTFQVVPAFAFSGPTAGQESYTFPSSERPEEAIVAEIRSYSYLQEGWDGEGAAKPDGGSIESASSFVRLLGRDALTLEPTIHSDGSIILESENGAAIRFIGDRQISAVVPGYAGIISFDGSSIPLAIASALGS